MNKLYRFLETRFEKITAATINVLGNSITFLVAVCVVIFWLTGKQFQEQTLHVQIENIIVSVTFLILFVIQREFKRFSVSLHIKLNEVISANATANNKLMNVEEKTESELQDLTRMYSETAAAERLNEEENPV
jgi:low affinity Fe/Cu permease